MRRIKLTRYEQSIEDAIGRGEYVPTSREYFNEIVEALERKRKDAVLNIRVNKIDLDNIKAKAAKLGVRYQTFISEILHQLAESPAPRLRRSSRQ